MEEEKKLDNLKLDEEENKGNKILIDKINEKIAKDKLRTELRKQNMNQYKKMEMSNLIFYYI
jgi:hypothetical protein